MGYLGCDVCGRCIIGLPDEEMSEKFLCCKRCEHAYEYVKRKDESSRDTDLRLSEIFDQLERILDHATTDMHEGKEVACIPAHVLNKALEIKYKKSGEKEFWSGNYYMLSMACEVVHLFMPKCPSYTRNRLQQLQHLREMAELWTSSEFPNDPKISLSVIDFLKELRQFSNGVLK